MPVYVLEQLVRHSGFLSQQGFARIAAPIVCVTRGVGAEVTSGGLKLLGESEAALQAVVDKLAVHFQGGVTARAPEVIYLRNPLREPFMHVMVIAPLVLEQELTALLDRRQARLVSVARGVSGTTVFAVGPLSRLLGLHAALADFSGQAKVLGTAFSHYEVIDDRPPGGDAA